jgi:hypothetical protein
MPDNGIYLLTNVGFSSNGGPFLSLQKNDVFTSFNPIGTSLTLSFDMTERYCIGWRDIKTGEHSSCPDNLTVDTKYEQCSACQKRTGFNPAFYHATSVSPQQEARNKEPHILYLAHFGNNTVKVGISHAKRGNARLLEQGARSALILEELSSAHVARHYEAKIAKLSGFSEMVQLRKKTDLLKHSYDYDNAKNELTAAKEAIESTLGIAFDNASLQTFDDVYFPNKKVDLSTAHNVTEDNLLSGQCFGQLGSLLFCEQADSVLYLPLKKYIGYKVKLDDGITPIQVPAQQISLF